MLFFIPDRHPHELHIIVPFESDMFSRYIPFYKVCDTSYFQSPNWSIVAFLMENSLGYLTIDCRIHNEGPIKGDKIGVPDTK